MLKVLSGTSKLVKVRPSLECDLQGLKDSLTFGPADQISTKILIFINQPETTRISAT